MKIEKFRKIIEELYWETTNNRNLDRSNDFIEWMIDFLQDRLNLEIEE
jgi:hypothetical protein